MNRMSENGKVSFEQYCSLSWYSIELDVQGHKFYSQQEA